MDGFRLNGIRSVTNMFSRGSEKLVDSQRKGQVSRDVAEALMNKHEDYNAMKWSWRKIRLLTAGQDAVKTHDIETTHGAPSLQTFLLKPPGQQDDQYKFYVLNTRYWNVTSRTLDVLTGLFFYRDPKVDIPETLKPIISNMDMRGSSFLDMAKKVAREVLAVGRCGILVDYPRVYDPDGVTLKTMRERNIRPFVSFYYAEDIYDWGFTIIKNVLTLTYVVLADDHDKETRVRVLELVPDEFVVNELGEITEEPATWKYQTTLYEVKNTKETRFTRGSGVRVLDQVCPTLPDGSFLTEIPFRFAGLTYDQANIQRPPMLDVADLSIDHYRKSADISSALFHCAHPTPVFCGFNFQNGQQVQLGAQQGITTSNAEAHASYLELNGQSINEIRKERDVITNELASTGARLLTNSSDSNVTAETSRIKASGDTAVMNILASTLGQLLSEVLAITAAWIGESGHISVDMNKEFMPYKMDSQDVIALVNAVQANILPIDDFVEALKNGGTLPSNRLLEDYLKDLAATQALLPGKATTMVTGAPVVPKDTDPLKKPPEKPVKAGSVKDGNVDTSGTDNSSEDVT